MVPQTEDIRQIAEALIRKGEELLDSPRTFVEFSGDQHADTLLNDLETTPHAFVLACIMDRQIKAELAWLIPYRVAQKLGNFEFKTLVALDGATITELMTTPKPLHRFPEEMALNFHSAIQMIAKKYGGRASGIWEDKPSSAEVVYRFLEFRGVGPKIATMAANILVRNFKVELSDYYSIDISVDTHVRCVFRRLGLVPTDASSEQIIYRARALSPQFPGLLDLPAWEIGHLWCKSEVPDCTLCYMSQLCPKILGNSAHA
ncbi:MAG: iron-sulfur cluster loop [Chloroflexota bacterium]|jgi:endonuclease III